MPFFTAPRSFRLASHAASLLDPNLRRGINTASPTSSQIYIMSGPSEGEDAWLHIHSAYPNFGHLTLLVMEAVLEVVCVSFPGYIVARRGLFNTEMQKFAANLNVLLFTPCLIFTKLASQLTAGMLAELAIIPVIYIVQVAISYICSLLVAKAFGFGKRPRNFVIAMGVFGNSNSLPISLVLSLSRTISGLHWDQIPGDNDNEVGARGILYLLIFQQLGQMLRWSWGLNVLLQKSTGDDSEEEHVSPDIERGHGPGADILDGEQEPLMADVAIVDSQDSYSTNRESDEIHASNRSHQKKSSSMSHSEPELRFGSGDQTPVTNRQFTSSTSSQASLTKSPPSPSGSGILSTPANGNLLSLDSNPPIKQLPSEDIHSSSDEPHPQGLNTTVKGYMSSCKSTFAKISNRILALLRSAFTALPVPLQSILAKMFAGLKALVNVIWQSMNPPLFAMAAALLVASIPSLQSLFFSDGTFVKNSITSAIRQSGGVAVPLILVVLGANLARMSDPDESLRPPSEDDKIETKLLVASLISRMVLPMILMAPMLALAAKYLNVSILDDPIFIIVCFLLAGAPSALQLAQICQINEVYMGAMTRILFHSYVIWILPSTLILVLCALKVVEWATA